MTTEKAKKPHLLSTAMLTEEFKWSRTSIWRFRKAEDNPLPSIKIRNRLYFDYLEVLKWLERETI